MATVGNTAPSTNTVYYDSLLSTTLMNYQKKLADNIFKDSALLALMRKNGSVVKQDGGERAALPLLYGKNDTVAVHSGYEEISTVPQDGITTAFYEWAEIAGTISISRKEERQNSGEGRLIGLLDAKIQQAEMTMREELNEGLMFGRVDSSTFVPKQSRGAANGLNPLFWFARKDPETDPVAGGNVGNISGSTYDWWRTRVADASTGSGAGHEDFVLNVTTFTGLKIAMKRLYNFCSRGGGGAPDFGVIDQVGFETYESALDENVRYMDTKMADMGFDTIKLRGATLIWDEVVPDLENGTEAITTGTLFLGNTKFLKLVIDSMTDLITTPFVEPENQTAKTAKILFMGQLCCSNLRKLGALYGISQSIVA
jgi:hypothetical protein